MLSIDPYDEINMARNMTSIVIVSHISKLEADNGKLSHNFTEIDHLIYELCEKITQLEHALQQASDHLAWALDEKRKLVSERNLTWY